MAGRIAEVSAEGRKDQIAMMQAHSVEGYRRKMTHTERMLTHSPCAILTMVARIKGSVSESMLRSALSRARQRHHNLRARIVEDDQGDLWFTSEGAGPISLELLTRESDDHWIAEVEKAARVPFEFHAQPPIRFILLQSPSASDLIILCHHIICDGLSLAYLARDMMHYLGDPASEAVALAEPVLVTSDTVPDDVRLNPIMRLVLRQVGKRWERERIVFDRQDYLDLNDAYWMHYTHRVLLVELTESQTSAFVGRCRKEEVAVGSALSAAFEGAQRAVLEEMPRSSRVHVELSLRDHLRAPAGEVMGLYSGVVPLNFRYDRDAGFWQNARRFHLKFSPLVNSRSIFGHLLNWFELDPTLIEAVNFKKLGRLVPENAARHQKLSEFSKRNDVLRTILRPGKMDSLDNTKGMAVTNLTPLDFPTRFGSLELDRLVMKPGSGLPLANFNLVLGAVTCAGKLSLVVEFVEQNVGVDTVKQIGNRALEFLFAD